MGIYIDDNEIVCNTMCGSVFMFVMLLLNEDRQFTQKSLCTSVFCTYQIKQLSTTLAVTSIIVKYHLSLIYL
jgi:hypothetical protein